MSEKLITKNELDYCVHCVWLDYCVHCGCPKDVCCEKNSAEQLRNILDTLDWIAILHAAIENRKTSWGLNPIKEWRNASDEILSEVKRAFAKKNNIEG